MFFILLPLTYLVTNQTEQRMAIGMDPEVTKYFKKILKSLFAGLLWLMINIAAGIYYELAYSKSYPVIVHVLFYIWLAGSLVLLLWYLYKIWRK